MNGHFRLSKCTQKEKHLPHFQHLRTLESMLVQWKCLWKYFTMFYIMDKKDNFYGAFENNRHLNPRQCSGSVCLWKYFTVSHYGYKGKLCWYTAIFESQWTLESMSVQCKCLWHYFTISYIVWIRLVALIEDNGHLSLCQCSHF